MILAASTATHGGSRASATTTLIDNLNMNAPDHTDLAVVCQHSGNRVVLTRTQEPIGYVVFRSRPPVAEPVLEGRG
jgi:hypothetical protein